MNTLVVERPRHGTLVVVGPDARAWLNGLLTCDVASLRPGQGAWGLALTKQGKIIAETDVVASPEALFVCVSPGRAAILAEILDRHLVMEDAELSDQSAALGWVTLHGPRASAVAAAVAPAHSGHAAGIDWTGLGGAAVVAPRAALDDLLAALVASGDDVVLAGSDDWERLRIEHAVPEFGRDFNDGDKPHEASLDHRAVSWTKGCYLGQEVVCMQDMRGKVKRRVVALAVDASTPPAVGASVVGAEGELGHVTSSAFSARVGKPVVLAMAAVDVADPGAALAVEGAPATLLALDRTASP